jgi:hypothetical protein
MAWALALVATTSAVAAASVMSVHAGLVSRRPQVVDDLPTYGDELRALPPYGDSPSDAARPGPAYGGPGWYPRSSPDGAYVAATESWGGFVGEVVLGLVIDRPFIHSVGVWNEHSGHFVRVLSIKEADPHSGIAHRYAWSRDSKALLIYGSGRLSDDYEKVLRLCVVYLPHTDELYRLATCPGLN